MINYNNGKIYKIEPIFEHDEKDIYIGSTTKQHLSQRMAFHRGGYKGWKNNKQNKTMSYDLFDKYGLENCQIVLLENVCANSKDELQAREKHYIKIMKCINKCMPTITHEENLEQKRLYHHKNKSHLNKLSKIYYENNTDILLEKRKLKYNCECGTICGMYGKQEHFRTQKHQKFINKII